MKVKRSPNGTTRSVRISLTLIRMDAGMCGVSQTFVGRVGRELSTVDSCLTRTGRDGKARRLPAKAAAPTKPIPVNTNLTTREDREAHRAVMEIARNLAGVEGEVIEAVHQYTPGLGGCT